MMIAIEDCIGLSGLTKDEVDAIAVLKIALCRFLQEHETARTVKL
jgi:hypothetical protein